MSRLANNCVGALAYLACPILLGFHCGPGVSEGVIINLVNNPRINSIDEILSQVAFIELVFDSLDGFTGVDGTSSSVGDFEVDDVDGDGMLELMLSLDVQGSNSLPRGQIDPGRNRDRRIAIRVRGVDASGAVVAAGELSAKRIFVPGRVVNELVPFNLTNQNLAPRIVWVSPETLPAPGTLRSLAFHSSKPLDEESLADHVHVYMSSDFNNETDVQGTLVGPQPCPFGTEMWRFVPSQNECTGTLGSPEIRLVLDPAITDQQGRGLVDDIGQPGFTRTLRSPSGLGFEFGDCFILLPICSGVFSDLFCIAGMYHPIPCVSSPTGCIGSLQAFDWIRSDSLAQCVNWWEESQLGNGFCVFSQTAGSCFDGPCADDRLECVEGRCMTRLGACTSNCEVFGGCLGYDQNCVANGFGSFVCR